jgi:hypothetical protein
MRDEEYPMLTSVFSVGAPTTANSENAPVNAMKRPRIYLAHPYGEQELARAIQAQLEAMGIQVINPFIHLEKPEWSDAIRVGVDLPLEQCDEMLEGDLGAIEIVDAVVAVYSDKISIGTSCEGMWASRHVKIPVFSLYLVKKYSFIHPWVRSLTQVHRTVSALLKSMEAWRDNGTYERGKVYE